MKKELTQSPGSANYEYDLFISYNRKDVSFIEFLVNILEEANVQCFKDTTGLEILD